jgi:hypothetical protein
MYKKQMFRTQVALAGFLLILTQACFAKLNDTARLVSSNVTLYVNPAMGRDSHSGNAESPLRTLGEAARRVNRLRGTGPVTVFLTEGIYSLDSVVKFQPEDWKFTRNDRLIIRGVSLPDDSDWQPAKMPVIVSVMPLAKDNFGTTAYGIQVEAEHVTIQGLRVLGMPIHEKPADGIVQRVYPIVREGRNLDDLRITQCLFIGDRIAIPNHLPILVDGQGIEVDHCVFYHVKDGVVFFLSDRLAENCSMHHNLMIGNYGAAVWSWSLAPDFKYYNNVVANTNIFWVLNKNEQSSFHLSNSMVLGYNELVNKGGGALDFGSAGEHGKLIFGAQVTIQKEAKVEVEEDQTKRNYLHLKPGSLGADLGAGLFLK